MALLTQEGLYLKLELTEDNNISVIKYNSEKEREVEKRAVSKEKILAYYETESDFRYLNLLTLCERYGIKEDEEEAIPALGYEDLKEAYNAYWECFYEKARYEDSIYYRKDVGYLYPILNSISGLSNNEIRETFIYGLKSLVINNQVESIEEAYERVKENEYFGETEDV